MPEFRWAGWPPGRRGLVARATVRQAGVALLVVLMGVWGAGCLREPSTTAPTVRVRQGRVVREALVGPVVSLDPREATSPAEKVLVGLLFSALAGVDGRGEVFPDLAVGWVGGRGGVYWTVRLRPDAMWHDGQPVTADDVVFSLHSHPEPLPGLTWQKVDSRTIRFFLKYPDAGFPYWLATVPVLPAHLLADGTGAAQDFARRPVGTGPFRLGTWEGDEIGLLPHLRYHRGRPHLDRFVAHIYPSLARASRVLIQGEVDAGPVVPSDLERARQGGWRVLETHQPYYVALALNCSRLDAGVRRAISLAIDRHTLVRELATGTAGGAPGGASGVYGLREAVFPLPLISWAYPAEVPTGAYDPAGARDLLAGAKEIAPLSLLLPRGDPIRAEAARIIAAYLGRVGLRVRVVAEEPAAFVARLEPPFDYDLALVPEPYPANPDLTPLLHSRQTPAEGRGGNIFSYREPAMDVLLDRLRQELDVPTRKSLTQQVAYRLGQDVPFIPLWTERVFLGVRAGLTGPVASPFGWHWNVHDWWWREGP